VPHANNGAWAYRNKTERADLAERRENRLEAVEWAVLIFVVVGVVADILLVLHH
jgi:hypothetical protein